LESVTNNLPGLEPARLTALARQIRVVGTYVDSLFERSTPLWQEFSKAPAIGMHFAGDWPELVLKLWAIPEKL